MDYKEIIKQYADKPGGLIEAYHELLAVFRYLPEEAIIEAARVFGISCEEAYGVATFYAMFSVHPKAKNIISVCASAPCHIAGMSEVLNTLERELGIKSGQSTDDGKFYLELTECVGQCQATPVITINGIPFADVNPAQIPSILAAY